MQTHKLVSTLNTQARKVRQARELAESSEKYTINVSKERQITIAGIVGLYNVISNLRIIILHLIT